MYLDKWSLLGILIMLLLACLMFMLVLLLVWWYCSSPALLLQAALKAAQQTKDGREDEITILRTEIEVSSCYSLGAVCFFYCHWSSFLLLFFFFAFFFCSELEGWHCKCNGTASGSWSWSQSSSNNDTENDFDPWRDGCCLNSDAINFLPLASDYAIHCPVSLTWISIVLLTF